MGAAIHQDSASLSVADAQHFFATEKEMTAWVPPPPGLSTPLTLPSRGAALHGTGTCKPCAWFWKPQGCSNGQECCHCHACPEGEMKARKNAKMSQIHKMNMWLNTDM